MTHGIEKVRVYAISAVPRSLKPVPGVLHIHGGGQTVNKSWLKFWNERGYAALSFNWGGIWEGRDKFTNWGTALRHANHLSAGRMAMSAEPTVRNSSWYLWTRISRRALTALERTKGVDPEKLGIFGVSMGGTIVWPFAAIDRRVKAACAIYGVGWDTSPLLANLPSGGNETLWQKTMEAQSYADLIKCPILFLNATNDQHGHMDYSFETLSRVKSEVRWAYTPRFRHHIADEQGIDLPLWMDAYLKGGEPFPKSPKAGLELNKQRVPIFKVEADGSKSIKRVDLFYAVETRNPRARNWRLVEGKRVGNSWTAELPAFQRATEIWTFANVIYESNICLSSNLGRLSMRATEPFVDESEPISAVIEDPREGLGGWTTRSTATDPILPVPSFLKVVKGPDGLPGVTTSRYIPMYDYRIGDPKWRYPQDAELEISVFVSSPRNLKILLHEDESHPFAEKRELSFAMKPEPGWQSIRIPNAKVIDRIVRTPLKVRMIEIDSQGGPGNEPIIGTMRWIIPEKK
jgi:hypothetical protein